MRIGFLALGAAVVVLASPGHTQTTNNPGDPHDCVGVLRSALAGGRQGALTGCTAELPGAVAKMLDEQRSRGYSVQMRALYSYGIQVRDPLVLGAATRLADDGGATLEARMLGLLVILGQHNNSLIMGPPGAFQDLVTGAAFELGTCPRIRIASTRTYMVDNPLPVDYAAEAASLVDRLSHSPGPSAIRLMSACMRRLIHVPPHVDRSKIRLSYLCDNLFRVYNDGSAPADLRFEVSGAIETHTTTVPARSSSLLEVDTSGELRLFLDSTLVASAANGKRSCPTSERSR
jgi:hypothetical protein